MSDCVNGNNSNLPYHGLAFIEGGDSISTSAGENRILYYFDSTSNTVYRRVGTGSAQPIVSEEIYIVDFEFFVTGAEDLNTEPSSADSTANTKQPTVTLYIKAAENPDGTGKLFEVQTTVTQRTLDV